MNEVANEIGRVILAFNRQSKAVTDKFLQTDKALGIFMNRQQRRAR